MGPLVVLAYSGGLDTSAIIPWLRERYGARVVCFAADVGQGAGELHGLEEKARRSGAVDCVVADLREEFVRDYVFPTLRAGAVYARTYLLGTAMARPLTAARQVALAKQLGAQALAHGCTGKGNDQVRFELTYAAVAPDLQVIAPWREWAFQGREDLIAYVHAQGIPVQATAQKPYSTDRNLWHCSHEGGILEDPSKEAPEHIFGMTSNPLEAPDEAVVVQIGFEEGTPVSGDSVPHGPVDLLETLNAVAGEHGGGRAGVGEERLGGLEARGGDEWPAGTPRPRGLHPAERPRDPHRCGARRGAKGRARRGSRLMASEHRIETPQHQMWGGRFALGPSEALHALNRSLPVDHRLWPQDVAASKAWVHALGRVGVLTAAEEAALLEGLDRVAERLADGAAVGAPDEDIHTLVERLLYEEVGSAAGKLHTGRSRNDQIATDLRLWTLGAIDQLDVDLAQLGGTLAARARDGMDDLLPGYTHGQRAQPVRWAYVLLAHAWPLVRDRQRLADAHRRTAELPLGSGALAGSGFPVDRVLLKEALGFRALSPNALDVTGDRDFVAEILFALALVGTHLSRLAAELQTYKIGRAHV